MSAATPWLLRRAGASDAPSIAACAADAFLACIPRLGLTVSEAVPDR